jgi:hypothetical protein
MLVFVVVPGEERSAKLSGVFNTAEAIREIRAIFQSFELRLRIWIVVTRMMSREGLGDAQVGHVEGNWF